MIALLRRVYSTITHYFGSLQKQINNTRMGMYRKRQRSVFNKTLDIWVKF